MLSLGCALRAAGAQAPAPIDSSKLELRGVVTADGSPAAGVNVFNVETLNGVVTRSDGRFAIRWPGSTTAPFRLAVRKVGFKPIDSTFVMPPAQLLLALEPLGRLETTRVLAGRFTAGAERTAALSPLEVMTTPGGGDVNSAVKTLPGVQNADEGTGLFVRGGDYTETRTFIDGAPMFTAYQFAAPTGSVAGTINPFLTDGITFSAGGFGARWGNTLSGIVDLRPQGRPQSTYGSVNATLLSVGAGGGVRLDHGLGASATLGFSDLSTLFELNGNPRGYAPPPHGNTESAQGVWEYSGTGRITVFGLEQHNTMGIAVDDPSLATTYYSNRRSDIVMASLRDTIGSWRPFVSASTSGLARGDSEAIYRTSSALRTWQGRAEMERQWSPRFTAMVGTEVERLATRFDVRTPAVGYDLTPGAATNRAMFDRSADRDAEYGQVELWPLSTVELIAGARSDRSGFATRRSTDPRVSAAWRVTGPLSLTGSVGSYHQVADPAYLDEAQMEKLPAIRADMAIAGAQVGDGDQFVRLEMWRKQYRDLVALTRDFAAVSGLRGRARGLDVFARSPGPAGSRIRLTWSAAQSRRDDPNTLIEAPSPFDITNSVTAVVERDWANGWHAGVSERLATGRRFTDVVSATRDSAAQVFVPRYGAPDADRVPAYRRADIAISRASALSGGRFLVVFGAIQNPFNTVNVYSYTWTHDYATRVPVRSAINRTLFIGANLVQGQPQ
ncbi:MAG: TonB-dependent receptor plug domain-containing protein [Gemmatimonadales bacterium]